jgi:hypothetical protein
MPEETKGTDERASEPELSRLRALRLSLLRLHKSLLDDERARYERIHGQVLAAQLLQLVINDERFAWLHAVSELVVRIDEMLDAEEPVMSENVRGVNDYTRALLAPSEEGDEFQRKYLAAIQREPGVALAHREVKKVLAD